MVNFFLRMSLWKWLLGASFLSSFLILVYFSSVTRRLSLPQPLSPPPPSPKHSSILPKPINGKLYPFISDDLVPKNVSKTNSTGRKKVNNYQKNKPFQKNKLHFHKNRTHFHKNRTHFHKNKPQFHKSKTHFHKNNTHFLNSGISKSQSKSSPILEIKNLNFDKLSEKNESLGVKNTSIFEPQNIKKLENGTSIESNSSVERGNKEIKEEKNEKDFFFERIGIREGKKGREEKKLEGNSLENSSEKQIFEAGSQKRDTEPVNLTNSGNFSNKNETKENFLKGEFLKRTKSNKECPNYFNFIKKDLEPWRLRGGIRKEVLSYSQKGASFRLQIIKEKVFVQHFQWCYQTRALFTIWGILQLIKRYPGQIPDVELMFHCMDTPLVRKTRLQFHPHPPLLLKYCSSSSHMDVVFPDWSFWGWPEVKIELWDQTRRKISEGTGKIPWEERKPFGQWKGAVWVAPRLRKPIVDCDDSPNHKFHVQSEDTRWVREIDSNETKLENQCNYRYKIYVEGTSWSCSLKYIMACGSTLLYVEPKYFDFFSRALESGRHYIHIPNPEDQPICESLKGAIEWGEANKKIAKEIGQNGVDLMEKNLTMSFVYDYMFHFLTEYAKLQLFTPTRALLSEEMSIDSIRRSSTENVLPYLVEEEESKEEPCKMFA